MLLLTEALLGLLAGEKRGLGGELAPAALLGPTVSFPAWAELFSPTVAGTVRPTPVVCAAPDCVQSLKRRAVLVVDAFRGMEGVTCNPAEGAM